MQEFIIPYLNAAASLCSVPTDTLIPRLPHNKVCAHKYDNVCASVLIEHWAHVLWFRWDVEGARSIMSIVAK